MNVLCSFPPQDEFPAADESVDEFPSVLKWRSAPAAASMSVSLPNLLGKSSGHLSAPEPAVKPEQALEGDNTLQTMMVGCWGPSPRLQLKLHAEILIQKNKKTRLVPCAVAERRKREKRNERCSQVSNLCHLGPA